VPDLLTDRAEECAPPRGARRTLRALNERLSGRSGLLRQGGHLYRDNRYVDELAALVAALRGDPVFAMSLGSKELFHSNLLAWFLERSPVVNGIRKLIQFRHLKTDPPPAG
jgi:hypothetical protein